MGNYVSKVKIDGAKNISVCLFVEDEKVLKIGDRMNALNSDAYMNGYNWEAFFNYYLKKHFPDVLKGMGTDSEAGMYVAFFSQNEENEKRADRFITIIRDLIENESKLYEIIENEGKKIKWDNIKMGVSVYFVLAKVFFNRMVSKLRKLG